MQPGNQKCGAMTRKKTPCADIAMANGRCKRHGGKSTGAKNPLKGAAAPAHVHGIYSQFLSDADRDLYDRAELGTVDAELRVMKLRLARTLKARADWEAELRGEVDGKSSEGEDSMVLVEVVDDQGVTKDGDVVDTVKKVRRLTDFDKIEQATIARIESLEKTRKELLKDGGDDDLPDGERGRDHVTFSGGLDGTDGELPSPFEKPAK